MLDMELNKNVDLAFEVMKQNEYELFLVGGCLRDSLLGMKPKDYDFATNAKPEDVIRVFHELGFRVIPSGIKFGTVTVIVNEDEFEITTFRKDCEYSDGRRPDRITFSRTIEEDLDRRDFTINAMAYNHERGLVDIHNSYKDLKNGILKSVGEPDTRLKEDYLRAFRAIRLSSKLRFFTDKRLINSILKNRELVSNVSRERIKDELFKTIMFYGSGYENERENMSVLSQLLENHLPELEASKDKYRNGISKFDITLSTIFSSPKELDIRLAALFLYLGNTVKESASIARRFLTGINSSKELVCVVELLILNSELVTGELLSKTNIKLKLRDIGASNFLKLLHLKIAQTKALCCYEKLSLTERDLRLIISVTNEVLSNKECFNIKFLDITGSDLINLGFKQGKEIGETLNLLLEIVIKNPNSNKRDTLEGLAITLLNERGNVEC